MTDSRKSVSKFSDLRWFILFEDLYNEEGSLQANKTRGGGWGGGGGSGSFPDYTIFICKFKTNECFLFMKCFYFASWRHLKIVRR